MQIFSFLGVGLVSAGLLAGGWRLVRAENPPRWLLWLMVGAALPDGLLRGHHTDIFDIDEGVLPVGAALLAETARRFLTGEFSLQR